MERMRMLVALLCIAVCTAVSSDEHVVFVRDGQVFSVRLDGTGLRQLTAEGARKWIPRESLDGARIAFVEAGEGALGYIRLITAQGDTVKVIPFRPIGPISVGGMRFIEDLEWVGPNRLAVSGSVNPENCEYVVLDVNTGKEEKGDRRPGRGASPGGRRRVGTYAAVGCNRC